MCTETMPSDKEDAMADPARARKLADRIRDIVAETLDRQIGRAHV